MGSPLVSSEKIANLNSLENLIKYIEEDFNKKAFALSIDEIGGCNAFTPLLIASKLQLPVIDADCLGRAFPYLNIASTILNGVHSKKTFFSDDFSNVISGKFSSFDSIENYGRSICVEAGSSIALSLNPMIGKNYKKGMIPNTLSLAINIGRELAENKKSLYDISKNIYFNVICCGEIINIEQKIEDGFSKGHLTILDEKTEDQYKIFIQNEYLGLWKNEKLIYASPDIITILDKESYVPILSESISWGMKVYIVTKKTNAIWYTPAGLEMTSLKAMTGIEK